MQQKEPDKLGPFRIVRVIGRGGMGAVYEAVHEESNETVALKVLTAPEEDEELRIRFEAEIGTLKRLRHPNIVRLYGFGQENGLQYYAMEFVDGPSLQYYLKKNRQFSWEEVVHIGIEVCKALKHAHDRGIIHRDIKPANILLLADGQVKVSDYGIAHFFGDSRLTTANMVIGTIEYMAPEQAQAGPLTPKSDIYSLGALLYALITGNPPYRAQSLPEIHKCYQMGPPESVRYVRPEVPSTLDRFIMELLRISPEKRPKNAQIVARRLENILVTFVKETSQKPHRFQESENRPGNIYSGGAGTESSSPSGSPKQIDLLSKQGILSAPNLKVPNPNSSETPSVPGLSVPNSSQSPTQESNCFSSFSNPPKHSSVQDPSVLNQKDSDQFLPGQTACTQIDSKNGMARPPKEAGSAMEKWSNAGEPLLPLVPETGYTDAEQTIAAPTGYTDMEQTIAAPTDYTDMEQTITAPTGYTDMEQTITAPTGYTDMEQTITAPTGYTDMEQTIVAPTDYTDMEQTITAGTDYESKFDEFDSGYTDREETIARFTESKGFFCGQNTPYTYNRDEDLAATIELSTGQEETPSDESRHQEISKSNSICITGDTEATIAAPSGQQPTDDPNFAINAPVKTRSSLLSSRRSESNFSRKSETGFDFSGNESEGELLSDTAVDLPGIDSKPVSTGKTDDFNLADSLSQVNRTGTNDSLNAVNSKRKLPQSDPSPQKSEPLTSQRSEVGSTLRKRSKSSFTIVREDELDEHYSNDNNGPIISPAVWVSGIILICLGVFICYSIRRPTADLLYEKIEKKINNSEDREFISSLRGAEKEIANFLKYYPNDIRAPKINEYLNEIQLGNLERRLEKQIENGARNNNMTPVEHAYIDAVRAAMTNPEVGIKKLKAFVILFSIDGKLKTEKYLPSEQLDDPPEESNSKNAESKKSEKNRKPDLASLREKKKNPRFDLQTKTTYGQCVILARRRLESLQAGFEKIQKQQIVLLNGRIELADSLDKENPVRANDIRKSIIDLYGDYEWAAPAVRIASEKLKSVNRKEP